MIYRPICVSNISLSMNNNALLSILSHYHLSADDIQNSAAICCVLVEKKQQEQIQGTLPQIRIIHFLELYNRTERIVCLKRKEAAAAFTEREENG